MLDRHRPPKHPELDGDNTLFVIAVVSNPVRYQSRHRLYEQFAAHMKTFPNVRLVTVELAFGSRHFEVTNHTDDSHLQLRTSCELWHKENLINLGVGILPRDWKYMAWIDADVAFTNPDWAQETLHQLQHHLVVQLFETAADLGPRNNVIATHTGFAYQYIHGAVRPADPARSPYAFWHPGFGWACRREFYENVNGLIDWGILGSGDHHMALAMIGEAARSYPKGLHPNYGRKILEWQEKCEQVLRRNIGYVGGSLLHHWHGPKKRRYYVERWEVLKRNYYNPVTDIYADGRGVLTLEPHLIRLRDDLRAYFRARNEDSFDD